MKADKKENLKKLYTERLREAGYSTVSDIVQILPPTIMNITGASLDTAEKLFIAALKNYIKSIQINFNGEHPNGINKTLNDLGYMTIYEIAEAQPNILANALKISLEHAGELVFYAMEHSVYKTETTIEAKNELLKNIDREISHYLEPLKREINEKKITQDVEESIRKIQETMKLPSEEVVIDQIKKNAINNVIEEFMTVFPACAGFALFNKRGQISYVFTKYKETKKVLANISEAISAAFWKISLIFEEKSEYGWMNIPLYLLWIEAIRNQRQKRQLDFLGLFLFSANTKKGVGSATLTIKGIIREIERVLYEL